MNSKSFIQMHGTRWLSLATYLAVVIMCGLGLLLLSNPVARVASLGLGLAYALFYRFIFAVASDERRLNVYFAAQAVVMSGLLLLRPTDQSVYVFLFFILSIQAAIVLAEPKAAAWIVLFYVITCATEIWLRGAGSIVPILFNSITFFVSGALGNIVRQLEIARREKARLATELAAAQRQLQDAAVAEERNRLARDLHDSAKQQAFALSAQLDAARLLLARDPAAAEAHLQQAETLADQLRQELAGLIMELRPPALVSQGLAPALRQYVADWSQQNRVKVEARVDDPGEWSPAGEQALYRVAQEALANVMRHSQATQVQVVLTCTATDTPHDSHRTLTLLIADNGRGFDPAGTRRGIGLDSMRERLAGIGGDLSLESRPGQGTRVVAVLETHED